MGSAGGFVACATAGGRGDGRLGTVGRRLSCCHPGGSRGSELRCGSALRTFCLRRRGGPTERAGRRAGSPRRTRRMRWGYPGARCGGARDRGAVLLRARRGSVLLVRHHPSRTILVRRGFQPNPRRTAPRRAAPRALAAARSRASASIPPQDNIHEIASNAAQPSPTRGKPERASAVVHCSLSSARRSTADGSRQHRRGGGGGGGGGGEGRPHGHVAGGSREV